MRYIARDMRAQRAVADRNPILWNYHFRVGRAALGRKIKGRAPPARPG